MYLIEDFIDHTTVNSSGCWEWAGRVDSDGYGKLSWRGRNGVLAHRISYAMFNGAIPNGFQIDHSCHNLDLTCDPKNCKHRRCVNPYHLCLVTPIENVSNSPFHHGSKTHCVRGHYFDESNTYINPGSGHRACRRCMYDAVRRYNQRKKANP
jgi:hypothetical protein